MPIQYSRHCNDVEMWWQSQIQFKNDDGLGWPYNTDDGSCLSVQIVSIYTVHLSAEADGSVRRKNNHLNQ